MTQTPHGRGRVPLWSLAAVALALALGALAPALAGPVQTYVALGDSIAFGQTDVAPIGFGDQGYVKPYANWLATRDGGVRPNVINLAIPGETSSTYFTGITPPDWQRFVAVNRNYTDLNQSQSSLFQDRARAELAAGHVISHVSFALGANDFFRLTQNPVDFFFHQTQQQQEAKLTQLFADIRQNYTNALKAIRAVAPNAALLLLDYYNPFGAQGNNDPENLVVQKFADIHRQILADEAAQFHAKVVLISPSFVGHELELTHISAGNVHPTDHGYQLIADGLIQASGSVGAETPEPGTLTLFSLGALGLLAHGWRRARVMGRPH